ncbi:hypothetical protein [Leptospira borgpetersenii]|uniref:Uncharacterized protein n=1 Tax=Leptospira borgpetersenii serovar Ballum TaxID=280505 RepID=A0A0S2IRZ0_LEPBO|nr:hypothetical protein [Leptospira borgpetersenii]ALO26277.1 hypothetical protein LBBP_02004 [Leptospira borgpetersenii serovar Ballum]EKR01986.1 hypothetical protein LEP1GSC121_3892 [Leptospira borgpetersenii serovar Castellonis str. 200801910]EMO11966.1 hypothetical protein LEP1GSC137_0921 [Leptospira borgpetersenii str. Noumea 25]
MSSIPKELEQNKLNETLFTKVFQVGSQFCCEIRELSNASWK